MEYQMKDVCKMTDITYDALKFYCNKGLIPDVKRDKNNNRIFNDEHIQWIKGLLCLKKCKMSISEISNYLELCIKGNETIPERKEILNLKKQNLLEEMQELQRSIDFIDYKQSYYDQLLKEEHTPKEKYAR